MRIPVRAVRIWESLSSTYWFVPTLMVTATTASSFLLVNLDRIRRTVAAPPLWWTYTGGPEGARAVLETIAGSMITVASIVFSITIVSLTLAAQQLGPRLLRNFMRDKATQFALGTFLSTFLFSLLILRQVQGPNGAAVVPHISVTVALGLVVMSLIVLTYFIHHVASAIQASNVAAAVAKDLSHTIERLFPEQIGAGEEETEEARGRDDVPPRFAEEALELFARGEGYVVAIAEAPLLEAARKNDLILQLECRPGSYVDALTPVVRAWPPEAVNSEAARQITGAIQTGSQPSMDEDAQYVFTQLVVVAVRAMSPSLNDPFTATTCIDRLGTALAKVATRRMPSQYRYDRDGRLRVIARPVTLPEIAAPVLEDIRHYGRSSPAVMNTLLDMVARVLAQVRRAADREALLAQARRIREDARRHESEPGDLECLEESYRRVVNAAYKGARR